MRARLFPFCSLNPSEQRWIAKLIQTYPFQPNRRIPAWPLKSIRVLSRMLHRSKLTFIDFLWSSPRSVSTNWSHRAETSKRTLMNASFSWWKERNSTPKSTTGHFFSLTVHSVHRVNWKVSTTLILRRSFDSSWLLSSSWQTSSFNFAALWADLLHTIFVTDFTVSAFIPEMAHSVCVSAPWPEESAFLSLHPTQRRFHCSSNLFLSDVLFFS